MMMIRIQYFPDGGKKKKKKNREEREREKKMKKKGLQSGNCLIKIFLYGGTYLAIINLTFYLDIIIRKI